MQDRGSAALEQRPEFVGPAGGGDAHGETGERPVLGPRRPVRAFSPVRRVRPVHPIHQNRPVWSIGSI